MDNIKLISKNKASKENKQVRILNKEDIKQDNIREKRKTKPIDYKKLNKG